MDAPRNGFLGVLINALKCKEPKTYEHCRRVGELAKMFVPALAQKGIYVRGKDLVSAALIHDLGKIGVPDSILLKPCALTPSERVEVERHSAMGREILEPSSGLLSPFVIFLVEHHHERMDGKGYPEGLESSDLPVECRILTLLDCFDAICARRSYHLAGSPEAAIETMLAEGPGKFDMELLRAFSGALARKDFVEGLYG